MQNVALSLSTLFAKINTIFRNRNTSEFGISKHTSYVPSTIPSLLYQASWKSPSVYIDICVLLNLLNEMGGKNDNIQSFVEHLICFIATSLIKRGSYMSAHVLLNLLNELRKRDQM